MPSSLANSHTGIPDQLSALDISNRHLLISEFLISGPHCTTQTNTLVKHIIQSNNAIQPSSKQIFVWSQVHWKNCRKGKQSIQSYRYMKIYQAVYTATSWTVCWQRILAFTQSKPFPKFFQENTFQVIPPQFIWLWVWNMHPSFLAMSNVFFHLYTHFESPQTKSDQRKPRIHTHGFVEYKCF